MRVEFQRYICSVVENPYRRLYLCDFETLALDYPAASEEVLVWTNSKFVRSGEKDQGRKQGKSTNVTKVWN